MTIYLICWVFFLIGFIPASVLGSETGASGAVIGCLIGFLFGSSYAFGFWKFVKWIVRNPPRNQLSETAWMIIDFTVLPASVIGLVFGLGALSHLTVKFLLQLS